MPVNPSGAQQRDLTVAHVRERPGMDFAEVMFLESARIFHLSRSHRRFDELLSKLREAHGTKRALRVKFTKAHGGDIDDVEDV